MRQSRALERAMSTSCRGSAGKIRYSLLLSPPSAMKKPPVPAAKVWPGQRRADRAREEEVGEHLELGWRGGWANLRPVDRVMDNSRVSTSMWVMSNS